MSNGGYARDLPDQVGKVGLEKLRRRYAMILSDDARKSLAVGGQKRGSTGSSAKCGEQQNTHYASYDYDT